MTDRQKDPLKMPTRPDLFTHNVASLRKILEQIKQDKKKMKKNKNDGKETASKAIPDKMLLEEDKPSRRKQKRPVEKTQRQKYEDILIK